MWKAVSFVITALACATAQPPERAFTPARVAATADAKALSPRWVGPAYSGTWYTPERSGEGWTLQILENGTALSLWFTFPPAGSPAQQAWIYAQDGRIEGDRVIFDTSFTTRGPRFGPGFDATQTRLDPWGRIEFRFTGCNDGEITYAGPAGWGSGTRRITRITEVAELQCGSGKRRLGTAGARSLEGLRQRSGLWFDPSHNGEGWAFEELPDGRTIFFWYTYDENGEQAWTYGVSPTSGDRMEITDNARPLGTRFGSGFDPARVVLAPWGRLELRFDSCDTGVLTYASTLAAFGSGTLRPVRIARLAGTACVNAAPAVPVNGTWSKGAAMPMPASEMASTSLGGMTYVAAGFGDPQGFKRYDPASDSWRALASVPGGRDHALTAAVGGDIYFTGGVSQGVGDQQTSGWRYIVAEDRWESMPQLPWVAQSGAATLGGFAYFGTVSGNVFQFNPRTRESRVITGDRVVPRDHSQLVAFQGEVWLIGGRGTTLASETSRVSIFDPASETWRAGPALAVSRGGFAAAASDTMLFVAGGETLGSPYRTLASVAAIAAGANTWQPLQNLPTSVHGTAGAIHGNAFYVLGGSKVAGIASNSGEVQVYRWTP